MLLRCLHNGAGRTEFDLHKGVATSICSTSWSQCVFHSEAEEVPDVQQSDMQLCDCWTHTPALSKAIFCSFFFFSLLLLLSGLLESFLTHWYIRLSPPPPPPTTHPHPHTTPLSDWSARAPKGVRCSRWKAGVACGHPSAAPWLRLCLHAVCESGKSPWTVAGPPCILERTSRAEEPWASQRPGYSATVPPGGPCRRGWMRTCRETERETIHEPALEATGESCYLAPKAQHDSTPWERDG